MFKIKRPAIIGLLLVLLIFTGYLNYQLTQQSLLSASSDYAAHEEFELVSNDVGDITNVATTNEVNEVIEASNTELKTVMTGEETVNRNYFVEYRLSRDKLRASMVERLNDIVTNTQTAEDVRSKAQEEIMKIGKVSENELQIEGLVRSKGFEDALVFLTDKDIKVVVSKSELTEQDMVKILDIVKAETTFNADNIKIMKKQ